MKIEKYISTVKQIKSEILSSRYKIASVANKELLYLYFKIGKIISVKVENENWGNNTIEKLSIDLQNELNGLRGFSSTNLKMMKRFYEVWYDYIEDDVFIKNEFSPTVSDELKKSKNLIRQTLSDELENNFTNVSFSAHYDIILKSKTLEERTFYILKTAQEFWSVRTLRHQLKNKLFEKQKKFPNNFNETVQLENREKALASFRDQYLFDFIRISDEESEDEKVLENEIVVNIKKFLMSLGADFAFIGNQYRLIVEEEEYFIDLLFFNRKLQALVAFELKTGKFKPEYLGKMNFYLSALDEYVKQEHEKPSIGIILCKEKKDKIVEFSFRNFDKSMGVATYSTSTKLPSEYKGILPDVKTLKKLMD